MKRLLYLLSPLAWWFRDHPGMAWACVAAAILLSAFGSMHTRGSPLINMPVQWLWVSALPILLALIMGGYIAKLKAAGIEFELPASLRDVRYIPPKPFDAEPIELEALPGLSELRGPSGKEPSPSDWQYVRVNENERTRRLFLVHAYEPSKIPSQRYDVTIYLQRHIKGADANETIGLDDIAKAEFYFGPSWNHEVFLVPNNGKVVGVRTSAWGTFLAVCRVTLKMPGTEPIILFRYIDFEMAPDRR